MPSALILAKYTTVFRMGRVKDVAGRGESVLDTPAYPKSALLPVESKIRSLLLSRLIGKPMEFDLRSRTNQTPSSHLLNNYLIS